MLRSEHKYRNLKLDYYNCFSPSPSLCCKLFAKSTFEYAIAVPAPSTLCWENILQRENEFFQFQFLEVKEKDNTESKKNASVNMQITYT